MADDKYSQRVRGKMASTGRSKKADRMRQMNTKETLRGEDHDYGAILGPISMVIGCGGKKINYCTNFKTTPNIDHDYTASSGKRRCLVQNNDMSFEYVFQKIADNNSDRDELQLPAEEDDILDLISDDESNKLNEAAAFFYTTPHKTKSSDELKLRESDEELELSC
ncbi:unnamed protein product [Mytilus edulis]|uniref:Uncharacterized protein n=1 Tax=Mytilus edulis TaxID=6550 RepID=A0A8S3R136_MYTED|nr:unnamed protein product [Mytilus edulis]